MIYGFFLAALVAHLTPDQEATLKAGLKDIAAIDTELEEINDNQGVLRKSKSARLDEVISLRKRYPEIAVSDAATVEQVYSALYAVRIGRAAILRPLAEQGKQAAHQEACRASRRVQEMRAEIEAGDGYKSMTLKERLEWRASMDTMVPFGDCEAE